LYWQTKSISQVTLFTLEVTLFILWNITLVLWGIKYRKILSKLYYPHQQLQQQGDFTFPIELDDYEKVVQRQENIQI